ncbi:MAG: hypothetical protein MRERV_6c068 [Mycoplasmataceae bacterium RV_VA103A]|nr:MAG: hypothetical protein MRERV_6c068 [Mycoplasmataceae bacterium RV_VA103A]
MFKITIKIPNLTEKAEKFLEKEFAKLEKIFKKPREFLFEEALIRYMEYMEWDKRKHEVKENTKKNRDEWHKEEIKRGKKFNKIMKEIWNREQYNSYIVEALFEFLEDMEDLKDVEKIEWKEKKGKTITDKEAWKELKKYFDKKEKNKYKKRWDIK